MGRPSPPMETWCNTTQARASGCRVVPRTTRPVTVIPCASSALCPPLPRTRASSARLRRELPEVFRIEVLEVGLQRIRVEGAGARFRAGLSRLDGREGEQVLAREDRGLEAQRHRDRVRRPGVDLDDRVAAVDMELGVVG